MVLTCSYQYDFEDRVDTGRYAQQTLSCDRYLESGSETQSSLRTDCEREGIEQGARLAFCDCAFDVPESCREPFEAGRGLAP